MLIVRDRRLGLFQGAPTVIDKLEVSENYLDEMNEIWLVLSITKISSSIYLHSIVEGQVVAVVDGAGSLWTDTLVGPGALNLLVTLAVHIALSAIDLFFAVRHLMQFPDIH